MQLTVQENFIFYLKVDTNMKTITLLVLLLSFSFAIAQKQSSKLTPLEVVNKRMSLYNEHNFEDFIKLYKEDVKIYTYPDKLLGIGTENITSIFKPKFTSKSIKVDIVSQMTNGNHVINHEIVTENGKKTKYISIYEIKDGLIASVRFVRDH
jgi:hypothetical protein